MKTTGRSPGGRNAVCAAGAGADRDPVVALDDRRPRRQGQRDRQRLQRQPEGLQGGAGLQGRLPGVDDRGDRRVPRRQPAAHPAGVRGRHRDHDGGQGRDQAGLPDDEGSRPAVRHRRTTSARSPATTPTARATCCRCRSTARRRCSTSTRTRSRRPGSTPRRRRRPGRSSRSPRASSRPRASSASTPPAGRPGCTSRTSAPGTTCRSAPRRTASRGIDTEFKINSPEHVKHIAMLAGLRQERLVHLLRPPQRGRGALLQRRVRDAHLELGGAGQHPAQRQVRLLGQLPAVQRRHQGRAAELDHRRRLAVGDERQEARGVQGRDQVLHLPVEHRGAGVVAPVDRLRADHQSRPSTRPRSRASTRRTRAPTSPTASS